MCGVSRPFSYPLFSLHPLCLDPLPPLDTFCACCDASLKQQTQHRRGAPFVLIPTTDLVFYALGSGEYDEMACELCLMLFDAEGGWEAAGDTRMAE